MRGLGTTIRGICQREVGDASWKGETRDAFAWKAFIGTIRREMDRLAEHLTGV